ncbi:hypothetical protein HYPSUDRAFT_467218 [Hypholoma sublateritium FD-334 SS-4]|uniref:Uncharacterized protein n=1 Tax=Hypholoma sublateritium (strain FD-334 SS-4) TaxID=945553 RepID=A0A0D2P004_HYPSF|nr:hypothetical protein HYPSUDRAFT_467218 [Hypholoma sublateritium FD-334 SS-4]
MGSVVIDACARYVSPYPVHPSSILVGPHCSRSRTDAPCPGAPICGLCKVYTAPGWIFRYNVRERVHPSLHIVSTQHPSHRLPLNVSRQSAENQEMLLRPFSGRYIVRPGTSVSLAPPPTPLHPIPSPSSHPRSAPHPLDPPGQLGYFPPARLKMTLSASLMAPGGYHPVS